jgi:hypothetical protein
LRILAHCAGVHRHCASRTIIGERFTAAMRACKLGEDARRHAMTLSDPVAACSVKGKDRSQRQTPARGRGSPPPTNSRGSLYPGSKCLRRITRQEDTRPGAAEGRSCGARDKNPDYPKESLSARYGDAAILATRDNLPRSRLPAALRLRDVKFSLHRGRER